jgi:glycosyltransferase involved in cell wall biosynthesis
VVASGGRLSPEKGVGDFSRQSHWIAAQFIDTRFVIFGEARCSLILKRRPCLRIANQVVFAGFQRDLRGLLPGVDLLVNPSHSEEMPNIVLEAMAARVPVVATRVGGLEEISGCDGALRLVPPGKPTMLANEISLLLCDPVLMNELGSAGQMRAKEAYSLDDNAQNFMFL